MCKVSMNDAISAEAYASWKKSKLRLYFHIDPDGFAVKKYYGGDKTRIISPSPILSPNMSRVSRLIREIWDS